MKVIVYFIADPNMTNPGDEIVFGVAVIGPLAPGVVQTFVGASPFGGWNTLIPAIAPPYNYPVPGTTYTIIAKLYATPGYQDDNPANDANIAVWTLPVVDHDVTAEISGAWSNKRPGASPRIYFGQAACVNVTVWNETPNAEDVNVTLAFSDGTIIGSQVVNVPGATGGWDQARFAATFRGYGNSTVATFSIDTSSLTPNTNYFLSLVANVSIVGFADDDPCDNSRGGTGSFRLKYCGDVNGDGTVDGGDQIIIGNNLWGLLPDPNLYADVNLDCSIDGGDQIAVGNRLWELNTDPCPWVPC
jgi:hypothetical protein